jgi:hypothetical protein
MSRRSVSDFTTDSVTETLIERTGLTFDQVKTGLALMRTGRSDLIAKVIAGEMTAAAALSAAKRSPINGEG